MFTRSYIDEESENLSLTSTLVEGRMMLSLKEAINTPIGLKRRIQRGEDPISIWFEAENMDLYSQCVFKTGLVIDSAHQERRGQIMPSSKDMNPSEIYGFCKSIGVHPVHLVPLDSDPRLSLPIPLLHLLIEMATRTEMFDEEEVSLARLGIAFEQKRINRFLYERRAIEESNSKDASVEVNLRDALDEVLCSNVGCKILSREFKFYSGIVASENLANYPLLSILRNVAYYLAGNKNAQLAQNVDRSGKIFEIGCRVYQKEFDEVIGGKGYDAIWFLADIKDCLFESEIDCEAATVEDIENAIWAILPQDAHLNVVNEFIKIRFGSRFNFFDTAHEYVTSLASEVKFYFMAEYNFSKAKKKFAESDELKTLRDCDIYVAFNSPIIEEGTLYRRLMDNRIALAILVPQSPALQPK